MRAWSLGHVDDAPIVSGTQFRSRRSSTRADRPLSRPGVVLHASSVLFSPHARLTRRPDLTPARPHLPDLKQSTTVRSSRRSPASRPSGETRAHPRRTAPTRAGETRAAPPSSTTAVHSREGRCPCKRPRRTRWRASRRAATIPRPRRMWCTRSTPSIRRT